MLLKIFIIHCVMTLFCLSLYGFIYIFSLSITFFPSHVLPLLLSCFSRVWLPLWPYDPQPTRLLCPWDAPGRNMQWDAVLTSRSSSPPRDWAHISSVCCLGRRLFTTSSTQEAPIHVQHNTLVLPFELFSWCPMNLILLKN